MENSIKPWENPHQTVPVIIKEWNEIKSELHTLFANRESSSVEPLMKKGISLFLEALYWTNHIPTLQEETTIDTLLIKPVNVKERLDFILSYPKKFHSYMQLGELFVEIEKLFTREQVRKKASKANK